MSSIVIRLAELLGAARRPGDFSTGGAAELLPPALSVEGVGPIALPLLPEQARRLVEAAERAPYGKGAETIVDTAVRNSWQIEPARVRIGGRHWPRTLAAIVARAAEGLGVEDPIEAEFYKLLVYDEGSFFVSHRDTVKTPGMFATLVIVLPSACAGGELVVRHKDRSVVYDLRGEDPAEALFAAFYADCLHEVRKVTSGCRLTLVYNLIRPGKGRAPQPPSYASEQAAVAALLETWRAELDVYVDPEDEDADDAPRKLVYPLEHAYPAAELSFAALKGADAAASGLLAAAAREADCAVHLAVLELEQFGSAEYRQDYRPRGRWSRRSDDDDDDDEANQSEFEVGEIDDWTIALSEWRAPDGRPVSWGEIPVSDAELSPPNPFEGLKPDELHFEEASGNAGVSFERRYRRAALVVWPNDLALAVLTQAGLRVTVPHLGDLARRWVEAGAAPESPVRAEACDLAGHMIERWQQARTGSETEESDVARMLTALTALGDTDHIAAMVTQVLAVRDDYTKRDNAALAAALALFQAEQAAALVRILVTAKADTKFGACASLLAQPFVVGLSDQAEVREAAATLLAAVPRRAAGEPAPPFPGFNRDTVNASFVADLLLGLGAIDPALADRAATLILNHPLTFEVDAILVPAARDRLSAPEAARQPAVARVRAACLAHLRARIALPLAPPADWRRPSALNCKCPDCADLTRFLEDPTRSQWTLRAAAPARSHVETTILNSKVDLKATTDQRGRPYTLVCTKTQASYEARVAQRARDVRDAAILAG